MFLFEDILAFTFDHTIVSFVGAGGKTTALFALANKLCEQGKKVLVCTTTRMMHPVYENRKIHCYELNALGLKESAYLSQKNLFEKAMPLITMSKEKSGIFCAYSFIEENKIQAISEKVINLLKPYFDAILVESDGSRRLPLKVPKAHEPVIPFCADLVLGLIGLDSLHNSIDEDTIYNAEGFKQLCNTIQAKSITLDHYKKIIESELGLFKNAPLQAKKIVLFNKADLLNKNDYTELSNMISENAFLHVAHIVSLQNIEGE